MTTNAAVLRICAAFLALWFVSAGGAFAGESLKVMVISDLNGGYGSTKYRPEVERAVSRIVEIKPDLVISTGDMVGGQRRSLTRSRLEAMWTAFHGKVTNRLEQAGIPFAITPGNHDGSAYPSYRKERDVYREQWADRKILGIRLIEEDGGNYPFNYAFSLKDVLFISLDGTTTDLLTPSRQLKWLKAVLDEHGPKHRLRVVYSHVPVVPFTLKRGKLAIMRDPKLTALLKQGGVDFYLSGHHHAFYPGWREAIIYISQACLGSNPRPQIGTEKKKEESKRAITEITLDAEDGITLRAYEAPRFTSVLDVEKLPKKITHSGITLLRADTTGALTYGSKSE